MTPVTWLAELDRPTSTAQGDWLPDDGHPGVSALTVRAALRLSSNRAAVRLLELTGIDRTVEYAARFALGSQPRVPAIALGAGTVTLEALTAAYATFANRGMVPRPTYIRRVEQRDGEVLFPLEEEEAGTRAVSPATAFIVASLLRDVVDAGTGARVRREGFVAPAGGKTGTTDEYRDAWFVGFTPELAAGVWIGFDRPQTIMPKGYASDLAAPVWAQFMKAAVADQPGRWLNQPADVIAAEVCALSGALARDASPIRGVAVNHDHVFGSCEGRLVADRHGVRYKTTHKDAFTVAYTNLERFDLDSVRHALRIRPRGGRLYNFTDNVDTADVLSAFHAEVRRARTRLVAQDP